MPKLMILESFVPNLVQIKECPQELSLLWEFEIEG